MDKELFHSPPKIVTDGNRTFFERPSDFKGSICRECYSKFDKRPKIEISRVNNSPILDNIHVGLID